MQTEDAVERVRKATQAADKALDIQQSARRELVASVQAAHLAGVSQAELARMTSMHRNTISHWCEVGERVARNADGPRS